MTPDVEQFIRDFKSVKYYNLRLISLNLELARLEHKLTWGEKSSCDMTFEQMMSPLPMPTKTMRYMTQTDWDTMEDIDICKEDISRCRTEIDKCLIAEALPHNDLQMMKLARYGPRSYRSTRVARIIGTLTISWRPSPKSCRRAGLMSSEKRAAGWKSYPRNQRPIRFWPN